jgi:transposase
MGGKGGGTDNQVGYDAAKQVKGCKINALVDSEGGTDAGRRPLRRDPGPRRGRAGPRQDTQALSWLELIWADGGYNARRVEPAVAKVPLLRMEIVKHSDDMKGFVVLPHRWVVECTFSWFGQNRQQSPAAR